MEIPNGVRAALKALALVPATVEGLALYVEVAADASRPSAVRKRALFKGRLLSEKLASAAARKTAVQAKATERRAAELVAATNDGFDSVTEHKRWLRGEIIAGKPLPIKVLSAKHGGALDADPCKFRFDFPESFPEVVDNLVKTPRSFYGKNLGPGRAPYLGVRKLNADSYEGKDGRRHPFTVSV